MARGADLWGIVGLSLSFFSSPANVLFIAVNTESISAYRMYIAFSLFLNIEILNLTEYTELRLIVKYLLFIISMAKALHDLVALCLPTENWRLMLIKEWPTIFGPLSN